MSNNEVGYKRPPPEHRIQPGERRNPNGRRGKKPKAKVDNSAAAIMRRIDAETIEVKGTKMTKYEAEFRVIQAKALIGDMKAAAILDRRRAAAGTDKPPVTGGVLYMPAPVPPDEWEFRAWKHQAKFRGEDPEGLKRLQETGEQDY